MKRLPIRPPILAVLLLGGLAAGYLILAPSGPRPAPGPSTTMASSTPPGPVETPPPPSSAETPAPPVTIEPLPPQDLETPAEAQGPQTTEAVATDAPPAAVAEASPKPVVVPPPVDSYDPFQRAVQLKESERPKPPARKAAPAPLPPAPLPPLASAPALPPLPLPTVAAPEKPAPSVRLIAHSDRRAIVEIGSSAVELQIGQSQKVGDSTVRLTRIRPKVQLVVDGKAYEVHP